MQKLELAVEAPLATLTLNWPEHHNAVAGATFAAYTTFTQRDAANGVAQAGPNYHLCPKCASPGTLFACIMQRAPTSGYWPYWREADTYDY
jgi:hypothetical protein